MLDSTDNTPRCIACSIFRQELESLLLNGELDLQITTLDSTLHMRPAKLQRELTRTLEDRDVDQPVVLLYGDCHPGMFDMESMNGVSRTAGFNCCEILLGHERYQQLRDEGAFFLLPEWTLRWKEIFSRDLGLTEETARLFMQEMHRKLVYIDTRLAPVPEDVLATVSDFFGLPWEVLSVSLDELRSAIHAAIERLTADAI